MGCGTPILLRMNRMTGKTLVLKSPNHTAVRTRMAFRSSPDTSAPSKFRNEFCLRWGSRSGWRNDRSFWIGLDELVPFIEFIV